MSCISDFFSQLLSSFFDLLSDSLGLDISVFAVNCFKLIFAFNRLVSRLNNVYNLGDEMGFLTVEPKLMFHLGLLLHPGLDCLGVLGFIPLDRFFLIQVHLVATCPMFVLRATNLHILLSLSFINSCS